MINLFPYSINDESTHSTNWGIKALNTKEMWEKGIYGEGSIVAIVDTGCDNDHESLADNIIGGANFTSDYDGNFNKFKDNNGHGTHVAGIVASNNKYHEVGVAPKAKLLILKALSSDGGGNVFSVVRALYYAALWRGSNNEKVDIVCLSLGTKDDNPLLKEAIRYLISRNILVVVASGNDGDGTEEEEYRYPGYYNEVIQVGSLDQDLTPSHFSNNNKEVDVSAPGRNIYSTFINNDYKALSGTSMATPFIVGALALIIEMSKKRFNRELTEPELYSQLIKLTNTLDQFILYTGNGIIDFSKK